MKLYLGLALACLALPAAADKTLYYNPEPGSAGEAMTIRVQPPNIRLETADVVLLYDAVADQSIVMDLKRRAYYRMTRERAQDLAKQMEQAQEQMLQMMEQAKAQMSEEQRAELEQYMTNSGIGAMRKPPEISLRNSGRRGEFYDTDCEWIEMLADGRADSEMCVASSGDLGMDDAERRALDKLADLLLTMGNSFSQTALERRPEGIPIAMYDFEENHRIQLTEVVDESLDPSLFEVPSDFEMMSIMPGG